MDNKTKAIIFLASERGHTETEWFRSYNIFNFGNYQHQHKAPFGDLYVLNDDTLAGGKNIKLIVEEDTLLLLLPTVGAVQYKDDAGNEAFVQAGQIQQTFLSEGSSFEIANPYDNELVNFLQLWIKTKEPGSTAISTFDLSQKNNLHQIASANKVSLSIGKYDGRSEGIYRPSPQSSLFVFIIEGAFEVQNRLLETRDGLALTNVDELEFEALSNDAILLLVELTKQN